MTAEWYDLGQRLYAARTRNVVDRLTGAPVPRVSNPVAVRARRRGETVTVTAAAPGTCPWTAAGPGALDLLHGMGVRITAGAGRTLVTDDAATLPALVTLARAARRDGDHADTAAHIAWWADRSDYRGSAAVVPLLTACRARWITGAAPDAESRPATWRAWLGVTDDSCAGMLAILDRVQAGAPLGLLDWIERDDADAWTRAKNDHTGQRDWRQADSAARAAIGLRSRCDMADVYAAALLTDPLYRRRAVHTGHVVTGTVTVLSEKPVRLAVTCDRMDARLRAGNRVTGWAGAPEQATRGTFAAAVSGAAVQDGALTLTVTGVTGSRPVPGDRITLHPAAPALYTFRSGQHRIRELFGTRRSWLTTGRQPPQMRRDVPLDVLVAAAEPEPAEPGSPAGARVNEG